jgi:hypothetical protein
MKRVNDYYFICEKGHITVGQSKQKKKCDQKIQQVKLVKKGRSGTEKEVLKETVCGADLKKILEIPDELKLFERWDYHTVKAFMIGQSYDNLKVRFIECLQKHFTELHEMISKLQKDKE